MTITKTGISTAILLAIGFSAPTWAESEAMPAAAPDVTIVDGNAIKIECVPQAELDAMSASDKEKITLPVCDAAADSAIEEKTEAK